MVASYDIVRNDGDFFRLVVMVVFCYLTKGSEVTLPFLQVFSIIHFFPILDPSTGIIVCLMKVILSRMEKQRLAASKREKLMMAT